MPRRLLQLALLLLVVSITSPYVVGWWYGFCRHVYRLSSFLPGQTAEDDWDLLRHLGGNGPWIPHLRNGSRCPLPTGCSITQAHMISRHAERYPTLNAGNRHIALLNRLHNPALQLQGSLSFVKTWSYFTNLSDPRFENLTSTGPYAGTWQAFTSGQKLRRRYDHLVPTDRTVNFWSCDSPRDVETARWFADGFFGDGWEVNAKAKLHIIPESEKRGGDTLTPGRSCRKYRNDQKTGRAVGYSKLAEFQLVMAQSINKRLHYDAGGTHFTPLEVYSMMELCGFEILVRGSSPWCEVFTRDEWIHYEYARDLLHFYRAGPGNPYAGALGWLWLNATRTQLANDSASGVYHTFVHDGDIVPLLTAMAIFNEDGDLQFLPSDRIEHGRQWRTSDVVPMGGRLIFERVECAPTGQRADRLQSHVRLIVNEGPFDLQPLVGKGEIPCGVNLDRFQQWVDDKGKEFGDFREICGLGDDIPGHISFLHQ